MPADLNDLAFYSIGLLAELIKTRQITSERLTYFYLDRLKKYGPKLECVVTLTEDLALRQARRADKEMATGKYRGPLHGIPYGAKDLLAVRGLPTTWGAAPYTNQVFDADATVIKTSWAISWEGVPEKENDQFKWKWAVVRTTITTALVGGGGRRTTPSSGRVTTESGS